MPIGRPSSESPEGIEIAGTPARFAGIVVASFRYIASGSSDISPNLKAVVEDVGVAITSTCANASV